MKDEIALYEYLYQLLLTQIYSGILRRGQKFPSQPELCSLYNVGITTARRVTRLLEENGFIKTSGRKRPVVIYDVDYQTYVSVLLRRRHVILDIYDGFRLIMPALQLGGAVRCTSTGILESIVSNINDHMEERELYAQASGFFLELLKPYNNQIMWDLLTDSENFTHVPYLPVSGLDDRYSISAQKVKDWLTGLLELIRTNSYEELHRRLYEIHDYGQNRTARYLEALAARSHMDMVSKEQTTQQFMLKNRAYLYTVIARLLYRRILIGEFQQSRYIPSIPDLMREYSISQATAINAVAILNDIGAVRTIEKKGTVISSPGADLSPLRMDNLTIGRHLIFFLDALQILTVCSKHLSLAFLSAMDPKAARSLARDWGRLESGTAGEIIRTILVFFKEYSPYRCLSEILEQMDYLLIWGHYLERNRRNIQSIDSRAAELFLPLRSALERKDAGAFSEYVQMIFHTAYQSTRELAISYGISEETLPAAL